MYVCKRCDTITHITKLQRLLEHVEQYNNHANMLKESTGGIEI